MFMCWLLDDLLHQRSRGRFYLSTMVCDKFLDHGNRYVAPDLAFPVLIFSPNIRRGKRLVFLVIDVADFDEAVFIPWPLKALPWGTVSILARLDAEGHTVSTEYSGSDVGCFVVVIHCV